MIFRDHVQRLLIGADHAGVALKEHLLSALPELPWRDVGTYSAEPVDYPDFADLVASEIDSSTMVGVLICGSGQGMAMRANKYPNVRAALCWNEEVARLAREHNDANVLCLGARIISNAEAKRILLTFLDTDFAGGRHQQRVAKVNRQV